MKGRDIVDKKFIDVAYNTRGNELLKFVRAEVMEKLEEYDRVESTTEKEYNEMVKDVMQRVKRDDFRCDRYGHWVVLPLHYAMC